MAASFFWACPGGFKHFLPYFYVVYLSILLSDRAFRDDVRCKSKYGKYWADYCMLVPYKVFPYLW